MPSENAQDGNQPVHTIRKHSLKVSIWRNDTKNGIMHNAVLQRTYHDGEEFKDTSSLGFSDLANAAKLLLDAESWIGQQLQQEKSKSGSTTNSASRSRRKEKEADVPY
jgi:hypothetical protein